jgi:glycosyltransferase involved in cell wall biosynthesis
MRVTMVTEGTYPFSHGGVSTWCDQLIRGLPQHQFEITAITATGAEQCVWELPDNVRSVHNLPLWGAAKARPRRGGVSTTRPSLFRSRARRLPAGDPQDPVLRDAVMQLGEALMQPNLGKAKGLFHEALKSWAAAALHRDVEGALLSPMFVQFLMSRWLNQSLLAQWGGRNRGLPTVADAVTATRLVAHALRPLQHEPPVADLTHLVANGIAGLVGLSAKWHYGTPYVLSEHGIYLRERYLSFGRSTYSHPVKWLLLRFHRLLASAVYSEADLVAPGNVYNQRWETWGGVPDESIRTVYNGVDPGEFALTDAEPEVPTISWVGRVDPIKDLETLIRAFAHVHDEMPQARLRIFGGTPAGNESYRDGLVALVDQLGLTGSATFEGRVEAIQDAYAAGHVVALTSISEGFPYTVIEAMSCGRATVSTNVGGVAEAVGDAGLVVPPRQPRAFADACLMLLRDHGQRHVYAERARQRVIDLFTLEQSLNAFSTIYAEVGKDRLDVA